MQHFTHVRFHVLLAYSISLERLVTIRTDEWPRFTVTGHVPIERAPRAEAPLALGALELRPSAAVVRDLMRSQHPFRDEVPVQKSRLIKVLKMPIVNYLT